MSFSQRDRGHYCSKIFVSCIPNSFIPKRNVALRCHDPGFRENVPLNVGIERYSRIKS